jgi:DNA invertase Pin-like site-specific DNA recombinase
MLTKPPLRAGIYLRVSDKRQLDNYSLGDQERLGRERAAQEGWQIVEIYREEAQRGGTDQRPKFRAMLADVEAHRLDILIVWNIDRFSREDDSERHYKFLRQHRVRLVSLTQHLDEETASGWLTRRIQADFAAYYSKDLSEKYQRGKKGRVVRGRSNGDLHFGYCRDPLTKRDSPDPYDGIGATLAFTEYATGKYSDLEIAALLNQRGYRTLNKRGRRLFSKDTVRYMLQDKYYLGLVAYKGEWFPGEHSPLTDQATFDKCQAVRAGRRSKADSSNHATRIYPLSGVLHCRECELRYRGTNHQIYGRRYYQPAKQLGIACSQTTTVSAEHVESQVLEILSGIRIPADWRSEIERMVKLQTAVADQPPAAQADLLERQRRLKNLYLAGDLTDAEYLSEKKKIEQALATVAPPPAPDTSAADYAAALETLNNFGQLYALADDEQRKRLMQAVLAKAFLFQNEVAAIQPQPIFHALIVSACGPDEIRIPTRNKLLRVRLLSSTMQPVLYAV